MSVTFWLEDGPQIPVPSLDWDGKPELDAEGKPIFVLENQYELNVASLNFVRLFNQLGYRVPEESCGEFEVATLPDLRRRLLVSLNGDRGAMAEELIAPSPMRKLAEDGNVVSIGRGCQIVDCGLNDDSSVKRLRHLMVLVQKAQELNKRILFA